MEDAPIGAAVKDSHWSFFIPSGGEVSLLELGSGTGELSCYLAERAARVETLSFSEEQKEHVAERAHGSGHANVRAHLYRPGSSLEFADGTFDALLVDRMLNYSAPYARDGNAERAAEKFLAEAQRVELPLLGSRLLR